jgi:hypothetical protein
MTHLEIGDSITLTNSSNGSVTGTFKLAQVFTSGKEKYVQLRAGSTTLTLTLQNLSLAVHLEELNTKTEWLHKSTKPYRKGVYEVWHDLPLNLKIEKHDYAMSYWDGKCWYFPTWLRADRALKYKLENSKFDFNLYWRGLKNERGEKA